MKWLLKVFLILLLAYLAGAQVLTRIVGGHWMDWGQLAEVALPVSVLQSLAFGWWQRGKQ